MDAPVVFLLAHGAGAGMDTPFMADFARGLAEKGALVARFEFDYMILRRRTGGKRPPDRQPKLLARLRDVIAAMPKNKKLIIGGKSMGGRMASILASGVEGDDPARFPGLLCLGYPFHPPGKPEQLRLDHFADLCLPTLICQGSRDPFGTRDEVANYGLPNCVSMHWLEDGEHSFKPRKASGLTLDDNMKSAVRAAASLFL